MLLAWLLACPRPTPPDALIGEDGAAGEAARAAPTGAVVNGVWADRRYPWTLRVPAGWEVRPGDESDGPRASFAHAESGAVLQVWALPDGEPGPHTRAGCAWQFVDTAGYRALPSPPTRVATCTPADAREPRRLGYFVHADGVAYDLELVLPAGALLAGKRAGDVLVGGFRTHAPGDTR